MAKKKAQQKKTSKRAKKVLSFSSRFGIREERFDFIEHLSMLLSSDMDVISALNAIDSETRSRPMKKALLYVREEIESGSSLWKPLFDLKVFSPYILSLMRIGEETGRLSENMQAVVNQQRKERVLKSKVRSAMVYPVLVLGVTVVISVGVAWFILPQLAKTFNSLRLDLPLITRVFISLGQFFQLYGYIIAPVVVFTALFLMYFLFFFSKTKFIGQRILFIIPGIKKLVMEVEISRFGFVLGTLLGAGLPVIDALDSLTGATSVSSYRKLYTHMLKEVEEGKSFKESFGSYKRSRKYILPSIQQMVVSGEQSGKLSEVLMRIGDVYEEKTDTTTKNLTVLLEPVLLIFVWFGVVLVALAVILPLYSLIGGLR